MAQTYMSMAAAGTTIVLASIIKSASVIIAVGVSGIRSASLIANLIVIVVLRWLCLCGISYSGVDLSYENEPDRAVIFDTGIAFPKNSGLSAAQRMPFGDECVMECPCVFADDQLV